MYFVTGVSRGLGLAIARSLLDRGDNVCGIGRQHTIDHPAFSFIECDLSNSAAIEGLEIDVPDEEITLINNAGILGNIGRLTTLDASNLEHVFQVNTFAPVLLTDKIYRQVSEKDKFTVVNISSGAANRSIPSWAAYCASKAALNRLTENFYIEEQELGNSPKVYAVAPGVVDTDMQVQIRNIPVESFSEVQKFIDLKANNQLFSPEESAARLLNLLEQPFDGEVFHDLRTV